MLRAVVMRFSFKHVSLWIIAIVSRAFSKLYLFAGKLFLTSKRHRIVPGRSTLSRGDVTFLTNMILLPHLIKLYPLGNG